MFFIAYATKFLFLASIPPCLWHLSCVFPFNNCSRRLSKRGEVVVRLKAYLVSSSTHNLSHASVGFSTELDRIQLVVLFGLQLPTAPASFLGLQVPAPLTPAQENLQTGMHAGESSLSWVSQKTVRC